MCMFAGMPIFRVITATDMAATHTHPQVHPGVSNCQTILTAFRAGRYIPDLIHVGTFLICHLFTLAFLIHHLPF